MSTMKLNEIQQPSDHSFLTKEFEIRSWLTQNLIANSTTHDKIHIVEGHKVNCEKNIFMKEPRYSKLPVQFDIVAGSFSISSSKLHRGTLETLEGCPTMTGVNFSCSGANIKTLEHITELIGGKALLCNLKLDSLKNVHEQILEVGGEIDLSYTYVKEGGIGLILIRGLREICVDNMKPIAPFRIIQKYAGRPEDIYECQAELIDAGYEAYAEL